MTSRQERRAAERKAAKQIARHDDDEEAEHVVEPLRSELIAIIAKRLKSQKLECTDIGFWVDEVALAINDRMEAGVPGLSKRSATPTKVAR